MPDFRNISGLSFAEFNNTLFDIASLPGDAAKPGPTVFVAIAGGSGLPISNPTITVQIFPSGKFEVGTDNLGQIGVAVTYVRGAGDKTFSWTGGSTDFPGGLWKDQIRGVTNFPGGTWDISLQYVGPLIDSDFDSDFGPTDHPDNADHQNDEFDPVTHKGDTTVTWTYTNPDAVNPDSFIVLRSFNASSPPAAPSIIPDNVVGAALWVNGTTNYSFKDYVFADGFYTYSILMYKYGTPNLRSLVSNSFTVQFGGATPDINITGDGGIDLGGSADFVFIGNPSGIYTLVKGKTHDTLYERLGSTTFIDVKIPDPFVETYYIGD